jgi:LmbE family N-acetylglucosaminyl deacetylase
MHYQRLIISPHIDDEILGCGGSLNSNTFVLEIGVDEFHIVPRAERIKELKSAQNLLGFSFEILEDNLVNSYKTRDLIDPIAHYINKIKPEEVYIPYPSYNQDHRATYEASLIALRPHDINFFVKKVFVYEETQVFLWDYSHDLNGSFKPNFFREIDIEKKKEAYKLLESQVRSFRSPEMLEELARIRGRQSQLEFAEAFQTIRYIE